MYSFIKLVILFFLSFSLYGISPAYADPNETPLANDIEAILTEKCTGACWGWSDSSCMSICMYEERKIYNTCVQNNSEVSCSCKLKWWILLNTDFPFIGRCIDKAGNGGDGKSSLIGISSALTNIFMTLILTWGFAMIIRGWAQIAMGNMKDGRQKIINVIIAFAALGSLGILLRLINPNFFK